ncbi:hypothetical protein B1H18_00320 [Streptomyces tsukubensis]|uniref:Serine aminopeptidase S33 domain-containing protein n=1 Tax=Streptomyces tsukubensis TaxID=83656 RepID=A0A1V4AG23_9ACTN|nr:hypothetical protein B1H18_00320 [Streptomyces tsukubensis]
MDGPATDTHPTKARSATARPLAHTWQPPAAVAPRGTLVVLPGRGEHGLVYERFGRRIATDGYVVHALDTHSGLGPDQVLEAVARALGPEPAEPVVLTGSDTGALQALHAAVLAGAENIPVAAVIVAGAAPTDERAAEESGRGDTSWEWDDELAARTSCPTHRARLTEDDTFVRGSLSDPVPAPLRQPARPELPVLVLHGEQDPLTAPSEARALAERLPRANLGLLHDGVHDVLNDASHRTTAATVVLWLERLRADRDGLRPILTLS